MSAIAVKDVTKSFGAYDVLSGASFNLEAGERVGLVGVNGCGKTTLLDIIAGRTRPDSGSVAVSKGVSVGYLEQSAVGDPETSLHDIMLSARPEILRLKERIDKSAEAVAGLASDSTDGYEAAMAEYGQALEEFESAGGYVYENEVTGALVGLGFTKAEFGRKASTLSGGERTRLVLARLLVAGHDALLLDEPTNHLDIPAISWLEGFLERFTGTALIVSHDRYFLDRVATRVIEMDGGRLESYPGNYTRYRAEKLKRDEARRKEYELALERYEKEKEYINRMRAGVNARQAKGREKRLARFELPDAPSAQKRAMKLELAASGRTSDSVVAAESIYKSFGNKTILDGVSFTVRRGDRVGIVGSNGSGKSTLLKIILGELSPESGTAVIGGKVLPGYYAQGLEGLDEFATVLEELWDAKPLATEQEIRDLLGAFLFSGDDANKKVGNLSGGEKGRLAIAKIVLKGANLLVLDEPTNHLDIPSREALEDAVNGFGGTVMAVSHDRYFLDEFAGRIFEINGGALTEYLGSYSDYALRKSEPPEETSEEPSEGKRAWEDRKGLRAEERKRERDEKRRIEAISGMEGEIERIEAEIKELEAALADPGVFGDYAKVAELTSRYDGLKARRDALYELLDKELA